MRSSLKELLLFKSTFLVTPSVCRKSGRRLPHGGRRYNPPASPQIGLPQKDAVFLWDIRKGARDGEFRAALISPPFSFCLSVKNRLKRRSVCGSWLQKNRQAGLSVFLFRKALARNGAFCPCRLMSQRLTQSRTHSVHAVEYHSQHRRQGCIPPSAAQNGAEEGGRVARSVRAAAAFRIPRPKTRRGEGTCCVIRPCFRPRPFRGRCRRSPKNCPS